MPSLASSGSSDIALNTASTGTSVAAAPAKLSAGVVKAAATTKKTTTKAAVVTLLAPAPTGQTPNPDPRSAACKAAPTKAYCSVDRPVPREHDDARRSHEVAAEPHGVKWGLTGMTDTCVTSPATAAEMCVVQGTHGTSDVTVFFKRTYDAAYSPATEEQTDAIHASARRHPEGERDSRRRRS